jgi:hypothetical protein
LKASVISVSLVTSHFSGYSLPVADLREFDKACKITGDKC